MGASLHHGTFHNGQDEDGELLAIDVGREAAGSLVEALTDPRPPSFEISRNLLSGTRELIANFQRQVSDWAPARASGVNQALTVTVENTEDPLNRIADVA